MKKSASIFNCSSSHLSERQIIAREKRKRNVEKWDKEDYEFYTNLITNLATDNDSTQTEISELEKRNNYVLEN